MGVVLATAGVAVLLVAAYDLTSTTLVTTSRAGPLTSRLAHGVWSMARRAARAPGSIVLQLTGPAILLLTVGVWLLLLWAGWSLVFLSVPEAVVDATDRTPADGWARVYFAGFSVFTLGMGDLVPGTAPWQVVTVLAVISGLALTTMAITYLVPVVTAVTARRTQASAIHALGASAHEIVTTGWHHGGFGVLEGQLVTLGQELLRTAERHLSYPILHFYHSAERVEDLRVQLLVLDDAITLLTDGVDASVRPHPAALRTVRHAADQLVRHARPAMDVDPPAVPSLQPLRNAGIPVVDDETFACRVAELRQHRQQLASLAAESLHHVAGER